MQIRRGDRVLCNVCRRPEACVGTIDAFNDWYGRTVVTVYFEGKAWDHCDREVFYLEDLKPVRVNGQQALTPVLTER